MRESNHIYTCLSIVRHSVYYNNIAEVCTEDETLHNFFLAQILFYCFCNINSTQVAPREIVEDKYNFFRYLIISITSIHTYTPLCCSILTQAVDTFECVMFSCRPQLFVPLSCRHAYSHPRQFALLVQII